MADKLRKVLLIILLFAGTASAQFGRTYWYPNVDTLRPISPDFVPGASFFLTDSALILRPQPPAVKTQRLYNQNDTLYWNGSPVGSGGGGIASPFDTVVILASNDTLSTDILTAIPGLAVNTLASKQYRFTANIYAAQDTAGQGMQTGFTITTGTPSYYIESMTQMNTSFGYVTSTWSTTWPSLGIGNLPADASQTIQLSGTIETGASSGLLQMTFAKVANTSSKPLILYAGSWLEVRIVQ